MKVALISRSSLFSVKGGDTTQIVKTGEELNKLGVQTEIKLANEKINYEEYDLLHFFNLIRPADHACCSEVPAESHGEIIVLLEENQRVLFIHVAEPLALDFQEEMGSQPPLQLKTGTH